MVEIERGQVWLSTGDMTEGQPFEVTDIDDGIITVVNLYKSSMPLQWPEDMFRDHFRLLMDGDGR